MSGSGLDEALWDVWEWSGGLPGCLGVVGRPSRMSESGREAWVWLKGYPECPGVVWRLSRKFGSGRETIPDVREWLEAFLDVREWSG